MTGPARTASPRAGPAAAAVLAAVLLAATAAGCGQDASSSQAAATAPASATAAPGGPACAQLLARLRRVTVAISTSSELIAHSAGKRQLSERIAVEAQQLRRSAALMAAGPVPAPLVPADRQLIAALAAFSADFERAKQPAQRGDFQAAVKAMGDKAVVREIVSASSAIQHACGRGTR